MKISTEARLLSQKCIRELEGRWKTVDDLVLLNQEKVLSALIEERISSTHLLPSQGYGYGDIGREGLDRVYARVFQGEKAIVRLNWASGTHVIKTALFAMLRPGDHLLSLTGTPYDTLGPVIKALSELGVTYGETTCLLDFQEGRIDENGFEQNLSESIRENTKVVFIQRSRGYQLRKSISMASIEKAAKILSRKWPQIHSVVDNCYCEFTDENEPPSLGITLTVGSLIKNPGGGLAPTGGYAVGKSWAIGKVAENLFAPGLGLEVGSNPFGYKDMYQGLFLAPKITGEALKGALFVARFFEEMGYRVDPGPWDKRCDIVQSIIMETPEALKALAKEIQMASPIDSFAQPLPWDMPGYSSQVIMAAGAFVQGSSIELSCDAPFIPPYVAYVQGGLTKEHTIIACMNAFDHLPKRNDSAEKP